MKLAAIVPKTKRDCMIARRTMTAKDGFKIGKRFYDHAANMRHFVF